MLDEAFDSAETFRERKQMTALEHAPCIIEAAAQHRGHNAPVAAGHLPLRERVLRVTREPGVVDTLDARMALQKLGDRQRVAAVPFHPERERLDPAQRQKRVEL